MELREAVRVFANWLSLCGDRVFSRRDATRAFVSAANLARNVRLVPGHDARRDRAICILGILSTPYRLPVVRYFSDSPMSAQEMVELSRRELSESEQTAVARLFSAGVIRQLAREGKSPLFARLAAQSGLATESAADTRLGDFFDAAFRVMSRRPNRHEYVYKNALAQKVLLGKHSLKSATMLTEFRVGECKADVVILIGTSVAYEIKSERDSLARLERQVSEYVQVFDLVNVVIGENHVDATLSTVPDDVEVLVLSGRFKLKTVRAAKSNVTRLVPTKICGMRPKTRG